jgi:hypothetical protein
MPASRIKVLLLFKKCWMTYKKEIRWRPVRDWPQYEVSEDGRVRHAVTGREKAQQVHVGRYTAYLRVRLATTGYSQHKRVHRLVAEAFVLNDDPDNKTQVDHHDDDSFNNHYTNLRWTTGKDNLKKRDQRKKNESVIEKLKRINS